MLVLLETFSQESLLLEKLSKIKFLFPLISSIISFLTMGPTVDVSLDKRPACSSRKMLVSC